MQHSLVFILFVLLLLLTGGNVFADDYKDIEWIELMPADDLQALLNPPEFLADIEDGSSEDSIEGLSDLAVESEQAKRFQKALKSTQVIPSFNKQRIRIPGFIVPLESNEQEQIVQFFIVPYFGACLHMPPPPPNQMIYVEHLRGIELASLYEPFWFEGKLIVDNTHKELGISAYSMQLDASYAFE